MSDTMLTTMRRYALAAVLSAMLAVPAFARHAEQSGGTVDAGAGGLPEAHTVQDDCTSLSEAVEQVRRRGDVERVISAETKVSQGREVHYIRVMTRDGKVRTERVNGCRRN